MHVVCAWPPLPCCTRLIDNAAFSAASTADMGVEAANVQWRTYWHRICCSYCVSTCQSEWPEPACRCCNGEDSYARSYENEMWYKVNMMCNVAAVEARQ